jgi:hypothetical protein
MCGERCAEDYTKRHPQSHRSHVQSMTCFDDVKVCTRSVLPTLLVDQSPLDHVDTISIFCTATEDPVKSLGTIAPQTLKGR